MVEIIPGKEIAEKILQEVKIKIESMNQKPRLGILLASFDESSHKYVELKMKKAEEVGIETKLYHYDETSSKELLINEIKKFKYNEALTGVLIQLPFYPNLEEDENEIVNALDPIKDVDGLTAVQQGMSSHLISGSILPAAVEATLECLNYCFDENLTWDNIVSNYRSLTSLKGKNIVILNNSNLVGKPLAQILSTLGATVTIANNDTKNLSEFTESADIIVAATGKTNLIDHSMIKDGAILIDITSTVVDGKAKGDFIVSDELNEKASFITPVPGGVGPVTIACLLRNLVR